MMNAMDTAVGKIDDAVRADTKLYEHSIMIFSTVRKASGLQFLLCNWLWLGLPYLIAMFTRTEFSDETLWYG